ncbi:fumarylacetoacetate hydrolase family protein [Microbacterium sp. UBA3394]|uniref:fumarylacetoacetate hydrolase family protein n=1 Tax=Microbacterium sp. UBA3394 TaxID=1946945 RepID=UPI00257B4DBC|nr:fumarylacetoacetate hydrolase family protein [Microbacterium sp. UBA3394]|tara:strand:- start:5434 stop:6612 length:1179 start_codon:yes stop_codon:yes gene_type:complete
MIDWTLTAPDTLPADADRATLVGRVWDPGVDGPCVVVLRGDTLWDVTETFPTMRTLTERDDAAAAAATAAGRKIAGLGEILANTNPDARDVSRPWLLSPIDLHVVKAAGVTFPVSMLERIIEERARGEADAAEGVRAQISGALGSDLTALVPGSPEAIRLKEVLIAEGLWSQYLEVGIGPDAEIFTKAPVMSTVGTSVDVGIRQDSQWNNPEPEIVLVISSSGMIVGATLGNDVNLRDIEGRSALLLGQAKDNNGSAAVGPFIRLFDDDFGLDELRNEVVTLSVQGADGFRMSGTSPLAQISRDPADLAAQAIGAHHQYPDGLVLFLGTMFAPIDDRDEPGHGFTHHLDDVVEISSPRLGALVNRVRHSDAIPPWDFGIAALFTSLATRKVL